MVYRRFGRVFSRLLLAKQEEISRLEELLDAMDRQDQRKGFEKYLRSHFEDQNRGPVPPAWGSTRAELLEKLEVKAKVYGWLGPCMIF